MLRNDKQIFNEQELQEHLMMVQETEIIINQALKGKEFKNLNGKQKDLLLETLARMFGLID